MKDQLKNLAIKIALSNYQEVVENEITDADVLTVLVSEAFEIWNIEVDEGALYDYLKNILKE